MAVYASAAGGPVRLCRARWADDPFGDHAAQTRWRQKGVDVSRLRTLPGKTAVTQVLHGGQGERVLGDYDEGVLAQYRLSPEDLDFPGGVRRGGLRLMGQGGRPVRGAAGPGRAHGLRRGGPRRRTRPARSALPHTDYLFFSARGGGHPSALRQRMIELRRSWGPNWSPPRWGSRGSLCWDGERVPPLGRGALPGAGGQPGRGGQLHRRVPGGPGQRARPMEAGHGGRAPGPPPRRWATSGPGNRRRHGERKRMDDGLSQGPRCGGSRRAPACGISTEQEGGGQRQRGALGPAAPDRADRGPAVGGGLRRHLVHGHRGHLGLRAAGGGVPAGQDRPACVRGKRRRVPHHREPAVYQPFGAGVLLGLREHQGDGGAGGQGKGPGRQGGRLYRHPRLGPHPAGKVGPPDLLPPERAAEILHGGKLPAVQKRGVPPL